MKKYLKTILMVILLLGMSAVHADTESGFSGIVLNSDEIPNGSYVIANNLLTRTKRIVNGVVEYDGVLSTDKIMTASMSFADSNYNDYNNSHGRVIFYKNLHGVWVNGLTGEQIDPSSMPGATSDDVDNSLIFTIIRRNFINLPPSPDFVCTSNDLTSCNLYFDKDSDKEYTTELYGIKDYKYVAYEASNLNDYSGLAGRYYYMDNGEKVYSGYGVIYDGFEYIQKNIETIAPSQDAHITVHVENNYTASDIGVYYGPGRKDYGFDSAFKYNKSVTNVYFDYYYGPGCVDVWGECGDFEGKSYQPYNVNAIEIYNIVNDNYDYTNNILFNCDYEAHNCYDNILSAESNVLLNDVNKNKYIYVYDKDDNTVKKAYFETYASASTSDHYSKIYSSRINPCVDSSCTQYAYKYIAKVNISDESHNNYSTFVNVEYEN